MERRVKKLEPNAGHQARREAGAQRTLYAVACRVEPMVTHPAPPQIRTCAINAYGSSSRAAAALGAVQWGSGDTIGEHRVSLVYLTHWKPCSTSPSLPWVPWALVPHFHRYYATLRLPPVPLGSLHLSLASRYLACSSRSWCPHRARCLVEAPRRRQGLWSPGPPIRACRQGDRWLSQVPEFPL